MLFVVVVRVRGERKWNYATSAREWCGLSGTKTMTHREEGFRKFGLRFWAFIAFFPLSQIQKCDSIKKILISFFLTLAL